MNALEASRAALELTTRSARDISRVCHDFVLVSCSRRMRSLSQIIKACSIEIYSWNRCLKIRETCWRDIKFVK